MLTLLLGNQLDAVFFNLGVEAAIFIFVPIVECVLAVHTSSSTWPCTS